MKIPFADKLPALSISTKLYAIFATLALIAVALAAVTLAQTRRQMAMTDEFQTAFVGAQNVERINSLIYAVVMESRGVYMSSDVATVKRYGEGLLKFNDQILKIVADWKTIVRTDDAEQFATFAQRIAQFVEFRKELVRRGVEINAAAGREWGDNDANREVRSALNKDLEALSRVYAERSRKLAQQTDANHMMAVVLTCLGSLALIVVILGVLIISRSIALSLIHI